MAAVMDETRSRFSFAAKTCAVCERKRESSPYLLVDIISFLLGASIKSLRDRIKVTTPSAYMAPSIQKKWPKAEKKPTDTTQQKKKQKKLSRHETNKKERESCWHRVITSGQDSIYTHVWQHGGATSSRVLHSICIVARWWCRRPSLERKVRYI